MVQTTQNFYKQPQKASVKVAKEEQKADYEWDDEPVFKKTDQRKLAETAATGFYKPPGSKKAPQIIDQELEDWDVEDKNLL